MENNKQYIVCILLLLLLYIYIYIGTIQLIQNIAQIKELVQWNKTWYRLES